MVSTLQDGIGAEWVEELKEIGYDYVELPLAQIMDLNDEEFSRLKDKIFSSGLNCELCNNFFPARIKLTGSEVNNTAISEYINEALHRAAQLGVKIIVFGSSGAKNVPQGFPKDRAWTQIVSLLQYINGEVKKYGITIVIEPINRFESNIVNTVAEGLTLAKEVAGENVKLLVDYYHLVMEKEGQEVLLEAGDYLRHIHFAGPTGRVYPNEFDLELYDYKAFLTTLKRVGYDGRISIEAYTKDFVNDAKNSLLLLKKLIHDPVSDEIR
jgi:sugar phosphate isomerase/epimerase